MNKKGVIKLSVVIPCYNYGKYLDKALNSVLNSKFKDLEVIIVNDGSKDNFTIKTLNRIKSKKYKNVKILNQKNSGVASARNNGLNTADGEYVYFLDADDFVDKNYFSLALDFLDKNKKISFVYSNNIFFNNKKSVKIKSFNYDFYRLLNFNYIMGNNYIIRKSDVIKVGGYKEMGFEDWELLINLGKNGLYGHYLDFYGHYYRFHRDLSSKYKSDKSKKASNVLNIKKTHKYLYSIDGISKIKNKFINNNILYFFSNLLFYFYSIFIKRLKLLYLTM